MNKLAIFSDKGTYDLYFNISDSDLVQRVKTAKALVIDRNVLNLYGDDLQIDSDRAIILDVSEETKTPEEALSICSELMRLGVKRNDVVLAIGGGITQDLVTFAASILFRGIRWTFVPTTLLAQADSCIGGKSSLNFGTWKNILGNFYPPSEILVQDQFLKTLSKDDIRSGIGEILKVHLLSGKESARTIQHQMHLMKQDPSILNTMILNSLKLKNTILEIDPLDTGLRLKMNYGHSFGHALEAATNFGISHGIAVTIGLDIANFIACKTKQIEEPYFFSIHQVLQMNLEPKDFVAFDFDAFITALRKDKKNTSEKYKLVIPVSEGEVELIDFPMNTDTDKLFQEYFATYYQKVKA